jgi:long-chain fatty acid transport protein
MTDDNYALYFNPAGMSLGSGTRLQISGAFGFHTAGYDRPVGAIDNVVPPGVAQAGTPAEAVGANAGHASLTNFIFLPFFGVVTDFHVPNLGVGLGVYLPFGGAVRWDPNTTFQGNPTKYPGAFDGVQRWGVIDGTIDSWYITAAGSYRIPQIGLSLGMGINLIVNQVNTVRARNADGTDNLTTSTGGVQEGRSYLDVSDVTGSLSFGAIWEPHENVYIGLSYQAQPGFGENTLTGTLRNKLGSAPSNQVNVEFKQSLPDILRLGARWRVKPWVEVRLFGEFDRWDVFNRQCILDASTPNRSCMVPPFVGQGAVTTGAGIILVVDRRWKNAFNVHAGVSFWPKEYLELFAGLQFDSNAVPDNTISPDLIDSNKLLPAIGAKLKLFDNHVKVGLTYTEVIYFDRTSDPRPRDMAGMPITNLPPARNPDGAGTYSQAVGLILAEGTYYF